MESHPLTCPTFLLLPFSWNTSSVTKMDSMFARAFAFNADVSTWDVSRVIDLDNLFAGCLFNQDLSRWSVGAATSMAYMFQSSNFNRDISAWDVSVSCLVYCPFRHGQKQEDQILSGVFFLFFNPRAEGCGHGGDVS
jgi:Mycoplasma protein of unknown function, DUF285